MAYATRCIVAASFATMFAGAVAGGGARADASVGAPKDVAVAVVIDFGPTRHGHDVVVRCLKVRAGSTGAEVLVDVATAAHVAVPTYAVSGLLCSIDGRPANGCGEAVGGGFAYWSYWHGGRAWSYASVGPATFVVGTDDVEGWRFDDDSAGSASDPTPAAPASYLAACTASGSAPFPVSSPAASGSRTTTILASVAGLFAVVLLAASVRRWRRGAS